jgi:hypothetical protein
MNERESIYAKQSEHRQNGPRPSSSEHTSQSERGACETGSTKRRSLPRPSAAPACLLVVRTSPRAVHECEGCTAALPLVGAPPDPRTPRRHTDAAGGSHRLADVPLQWHPRSLPRASHRAYSLQTAQQTAAGRARQRADCASSPFFPRSVGFRPTASSANGALMRLPSILCHSQPMPSSSA